MVLTARADGGGTISYGGADREGHTASVDHAESALLALAVEEARKADRPLPVIIRKPDGEQRLLVHPSGRAEPHRGSSLGPSGPFARLVAFGGDAPDRTIVLAKILAA